MGWMVGKASKAPAGTGWGEIRWMDIGVFIRLGVDMYMLVLGRDGGISA